MLSSYITISAERLRNLCERVFEGVMQERIYHLSIWIENKILKSKKSFWRRLFKLPPLTTEQIVELHKQYAKTESYQYSPQYCSGQVVWDLACEMLTAANYSSTIQISTKELELLYLWASKENPQPIEQLFKIPAIEQILKIALGNV